MTSRASIIAYVRHHQVTDYMAHGWTVLFDRHGRPILEGTCHGHWSTAMGWLCDCTPWRPAVQTAVPMEG